MTTRNRLARWFAYLLVLGVLIGGVYIAKQLLVGGAAVLPQPTATEKNVLRLLNVQRTKHGLSKLAYSPGLAKLAREHTDDMIDHNYFEHDEPGRLTYRQRVTPYLHKPGISRMAENIAWGTGSYGSAQGLVTSWMQSPPHRANILDPRLHKTGLGITHIAGVYQTAYGATLATDEFSN